MFNEINQNQLDNILKEHLVNEIKKKLHKLIDEDIEEIAKDAVKSFLEIEIEKNYDPINIRGAYYFNFVKNITKTIEEKIVIEDTNLDLQRELKEYKKRFGDLE